MQSSNPSDNFSNPIVSQIRYILHLLHRSRDRFIDIGSLTDSPLRFTVFRISFKIRTFSSSIKDTCASMIFKISNDLRSLFYIDNVDLFSLDDLCVRLKTAEQLFSPVQPSLLPRRRSLKVIRFLRITHRASRQKCAANKCSSAARLLYHDRIQIWISSNPF